MATVTKVSVTHYKGTSSGANNILGYESSKTRNYVVAFTVDSSATKLSVQVKGSYWSSDASRDFMIYGLVGTDATQYITHTGTDGTHIGTVKQGTAKDTNFTWNATISGLRLIPGQTYYLTLYHWKSAYGCAMVYDSNITLSASDPVTHTLTLNTSEGVASFTGSGTYEYGVAAPSVATAWPGYSLTKYVGTLADGSGNTEWTACSGYTSHSDAWSMTADRVATVYAAKNSYKLSLNANGGSVSPSSKTYTYGAMATDLPTPTREGYDFHGWTVNLDGTKAINLGRNYLYTDKFSVHVEAYMDDWSKGKSQCIISCTQAGGWALAYQGDYISVLCNDSGYGYQYATAPWKWSDLGYNCWHIFDIVFDGKNVKLYIDTVLYATSPDFTSGTVTYNSANTLFLGAEAGTNATTPEGSLFQGTLRNVVINHDTAVVTHANAKNSFVVPAENITLAADWSIKTYRITYDANGGSSTPSSQSKTHGVSITLADAITRADLGKKVITTFNANGGTCSSSSITSAAIMSYYFDAWEDSAGNLYEPGGLYTLNQTTTMTARWDAGDYVGNPITLPTASRTGYTFKGWYSASSGGTKITSYAPTVNTTLYAQWTPISYHLYIVDELSGEIINDLSVQYGSTVSLPEISKEIVYHDIGQNYSYANFYDRVQGDYDNPIAVYGKYVADMYYRSTTGYTTSYTHNIASNAYLTLCYIPQGSSMRFELQAPNCVPDEELGSVQYWQRCGDSDSRLPARITPGSVAEIDFAGDYSETPIIIGNYECVYAPMACVRFWVKQDNQYKLCVPLTKANGQYKRGDAYFVKNADRWVPLTGLDYSAINSSTLDKGMLDSIILG